MSKFKQFTVHTARLMPVIILADISGSMSVDGKIGTLNRAIAEMIASFAQEEDVRADIHVAVITFGKGGAKIHQPLLPASQIQWTDMEAIGPTPMAAAFELATNMVEDKNQIPSRSYHPTIVLVSDGHPTNETGHSTDNWKQPLNQLLTSTRASKALRLSMGIGADAEHKVLKEFLALQHPEIPVFRADEASQLRQFFRWVTMTVSSRSKSANPDSKPSVDFNNLEDLDF